MTRKEIDNLGFNIVGGAIDVHRALGPGLLEATYHECLEQELRDRGLDVESEVRAPLIFKGRELTTTVRCDLIVNRSIIVELKSVDKLIDVHRAQVLTYMRLLKIPKGILINFYCSNIYKEGLRTFVNELYEKLPRT